MKSLAFNLLLLTLFFISVCSAQSDRMAQAQTYLQQGKVDQAQKLLLEIVRQQPHRQPAFAMLGQIAFSRKEFQQAAQHFRRAPQVLAANPLLRLNLAEALFESRADAEARKELATLPAASAPAQFEAGLLLARRGEFSAAAEHFLKAWPNYPKPSVIAYNLALAQYSARQLKECVATLEDARKRGIRTADLANLLGQSYSELGSNAEASQVLRQAIKLYPRDERNYVSLARVLIEEDDMTEALEMIQQGLSRLPRSLALLQQRAYLLMTLGRYPEAEADYRRLAQADAASSGASIGLAFVLIHSQRQAEATDLLEKLIATPAGVRQFFPHYLLGEISVRQGLEGAAIAHFERALAVQPNSASVRSSLGKLYLKKGDLPKAVSELEGAIRLDATDTAAYYQLSIAYRKQGKAQEAQRALAQVRRLNETERQLGTSRFLTRKLKGLTAGLASSAP